VKFIASLIMNASDLRRVIQLWDASGDARNPFAHVLVSPLFTKNFPAGCPPACWGEESGVRRRRTV